jgi:hypothetical protein
MLGRLTLSNLEGKAAGALSLATSNSACSRMVVRSKSAERARSTYKKKTFNGQKDELLANESKPRAHASETEVQERQICGKIQNTKAMQDNGGLDILQLPISLNNTSLHTLILDAKLSANLHKKSHTPIRHPEGHTTVTIPHRRGWCC